MAAGKTKMKATVSNTSKRVEIKENKTEGIINFDIDNAYPNRVIDIINASGTATLCTNMLAKFIYGGGFASEVLAAIKLNKNKVTANKLLFKLGKSFARHNGFGIHVNYNALYKKTSFSFVPFEQMRFTTPDDKDHPDMIAVYDDWQKVRSSKIMREKIDFIDFYDPNPETIQKQVEKAGGWPNYKGQIIYFSVDGLQYPLAPADSVLEDCQTDAQTKLFKNRNVTTNFLASYIMRTGIFEEDQERNDFQKTLEDFQGADEASKIMHIEEESEEPSFVLEKVDIQDIDKLYEYTEESTRNNIIREYLIPPILLQETPGKLGTTSNERREAFAQFNGVTEDHRRAIEEVFAEMFDNSIFPMPDTFEIIELEARTVPAKDTVEGKKDIVEVVKTNALTDSEKRKLLISVYDMTTEEAVYLIPLSEKASQGEEVAVDEEAKAKATLRGSVGGVTSILEIQSSVQTGTTSYEAGQSILEIIFGLSPEDAKRVLGQPKDLNITTPVQ